VIRIISPQRECSWGILIGSAGVSLLFAGLALSAFYLWQAHIDSSVLGAVAPPVKAAQARVTPDPVFAPDVSTISVTLSSTGSQLDNLTAELIVSDESGHIQLRERQGGITLPAGGSQTIYWEWRIPQRLEKGPYGVVVNILDARGEFVYRSPTPLTSFRVEASPLNAPLALP